MVVCTSVAIVSDSSASAAMFWASTHSSARSRSSSEISSESSSDAYSPSSAATVLLSAATVPNGARGEEEEEEEEEEETTSEARTTYEASGVTPVVSKAPRSPAAWGEARSSACKSALVCARSSSSSRAPRSLRVASTFWRTSLICSAEIIVDAAYIATPEAHSTAVATRVRLGEPACAEFLKPHREPRASSPRSASFRTRRGTASVSRETRTMTSSKTRRSPRPRRVLCAARGATPDAEHLRDLPRWKAPSDDKKSVTIQSHVFRIRVTHRSHKSVCECCVNLPSRGC